MNRKFLMGVMVMMCVALTALTSVAAQVEPRAGGTIVNAANNSLSSAYSFHPNQVLTVTNVNTATIEAGEVTHSCLSSPSAGKYSVWFQTYLAGGTLSLDTFGTDYGISNDSVISVYRVASSVPTYANLTSVGCGDNGTGTGLISNLAVTQGLYAIQVSAADSVTASSGSQVVLSATYSSAYLIPNDNLATAKPLSFPNNYVQFGIENATLETNELIEPGDTDFGTHSVWYKFTIKQKNYYAFQNISDLSGDPYFEVFKVVTVGGVSTYTYVGGTSGFYLAVLDPGKYVLRVSSETTPRGASSAQYNFITASYLIPENYEFSTGSYVDSGIGDMTGWVVKKASTGATPDGNICISAKCYFQFSSDGATEATSISATFPIQTQKIRKGDAILLNITFQYTGSSNADFMVTYLLTDVNGATLKMQRRVQGTAGYQATLPVTKSFSAVKVKITVKNMDKSGTGVLRLDAVVGAFVRIGATSFRGSEPLFGMFDSDAGADGVLEFPTR